MNSKQFLKAGRTPQAFGPLGMWLMNPWRSESRLVMFEGGRSTGLIATVLDLNCHAGTFTGDWPICEAYDGSRTHLSAIDPDQGTVVPIATFPYRVTMDFVRGWATGFARGRPFAIKPSTRELVVSDWRHELEGEGPGYFVNGDSVLGLAISSERASRVDLYRGFDAGRVAIR